MIFSEYSESAGRIERAISLVRDPERHQQEHGGPERSTAEPEQDSGRRQSSYAGVGRCFK